MNPRVLAGSLLAYGYNALVGRWPSRTLRRAYLARYLGRLGKGTGIQMGCRFLNGRKIELGDHNVVNFGCLLDGRVYPIRTGSNVSIGPEATILTLGHNPQSSAFEDEGGSVTIGDRVWIGYGALVLPGVTIGEGSVVAARSVVTRDVPPYTIVAGAPAKKVGERKRSLEYTLQFEPWLL